MQPIDSEIVCIRCGACCDRPGYVHVTAAEIECIADYLGLTPSEFTRHYTRLTANRRGLSLIDRTGGGCAFLNADRQCSIQAVKPRQCADFPWRWRYAGYEEFCAIGREQERRAAIGASVQKTKPGSATPCPDQRSGSH